MPYTLSPEELALYEKERSADRKYSAWMKRVSKRLPDLAARTFALRGKAYMGCGFHYGLELSLGKVIKIANDYDMRHETQRDKLAYRLISEVIVKGFVKDLVKAEKSAGITKPK